jgi:hypothetical protein
MVNVTPALPTTADEGLSDATAGSGFVVCEPPPPDPDPQPLKVKTNTPRQRNTASKTTLVFMMGKV